MQIDPADRNKERTYYFTFFQGHKYANHYVEIHGTYDNARKEMMERFGGEWAYQYYSKDDAGVDDFNLTKIE